MRVLLITSPNEQCGIREYGDMLVEAMGIVDPNVEFESIGPGQTFVVDRTDLIHVNHQAALHSIFDEMWLEDAKAYGKPIVITQHDTFETHKIMLDRGFPDFRGASALVIHEPVEGLMELSNVYYIRQGIPAGIQQDAPSSSGLSRRMVGSAGFPFPWKGYDALCRAAARANWGVLLIAPGATVEQCEAWQALNPQTEVIPKWLPRQEIIQRLSQCRATAWLYTSGNSGTSGAIRLGIAAGRPIVRYPNRQFRDLEPRIMLPFADDLRVPDEGGVAEALKQIESHSAEFFPSWVSYVSRRDSWENQARQYYAIYRSLLT